MKKLQSLQSFNCTYDAIKGKKDRMELQSTLGKKKKIKKEQNQKETELQLFRNKSSYDNNFKGSDSDHYSVEDLTFDGKETVRKDAQRPFAMFNTTDKAKLFDNAGTRDMLESGSKSMDVVVDIHREYINSSSNKTESQKGKEKKLVEQESFKICSKVDTFHDKKVEGPKLESLQKDNNDIKVIDTLDLIEEFKESPMNKKQEKTVEMIKNTNKLTKEYNNKFGKENRYRKQWATPPRSQTEELKKPARKRWSKDATVIRLPQARNSWMVASLENSSPIIEDMEQLSGNEKSLKAFKNAGFDLGEEILRVETDPNKKDTKIEIKEIVHELEQISNFGSQSSEDSYRSEKIETLKERAAMIEDFNEDFMNLNQNESFEGKRNDISSRNRESYESISKGRRDCMREKGKRNISSDSNVSQSLEEVSDEHFCVEESMDERVLINKKSKNHKTLLYSKEHSATDEDPTKNHFKHSLHSQHSLTSSEEDVFEEKYSKEAYDEEKLNRSAAGKKQKSKFTEHQSPQQKKEKLKRLRKNILNSSKHTPNPAEGFKKKKKKKKDVKYISITIHRTDMLEIDYVTKHPMVKVHIVNAENGKYLKNEYGTGFTYLQPMITGKFDFKENKSIVPVWEEELVFEYDFEQLLKIDNEQLVILFEIVDLLSFAEASFNYDKFGHESCWYKVAWAFLKPVGKNNILHVNKKVRLQLYRPRKNSQKYERFHTCEVYTWWKSNVREKYPSSLFVTIASIDPPKSEPVFYRQLSLNHLSSMHNNESQKTSTHTSDSINLPKWTRLAAQSCKIPNEVFFKTETSENGCFYVVFSNDGKYLASSFSEEQDYPIVIYEVESKKIHVRFTGHKTFIYSLNWSNNDSYLLSVSSDQTARIWDVENQIVQCFEMMPHPSYVYCGKFDLESSSIVATGCYDRIARIWIRDKKSKNRELSQELEGHEGFVNSMCFQKNGNLLTADSVGVIILWVLKKSRRVLPRKEWHISRKIKVRDVDGIIINTIVLHPLESRLLVHSRNNGLRMLDLATGVVLQKYDELNNQRIQLTSCISPCGSLIFCGGEDSSLNVWSLETGNLVAKYTFNRNYRAVTCVDYHPYDHVLAFSTFGSPAPVRILRFNKDATGEDVGLKIMTPDIENTMHTSDISMRFLNQTTVSEEKPRSVIKKNTIEESLREKSSQSSRTYDSSFHKPSESVLLEKEKYNDAKIKLQRLNEAGQTLKNRSANRLYNIIEKIDRILSNTSRSSGDIETGKNFTLLHEPNESRALTNLNENVEKPRRMQKEDDSTYLSIEDQPNFYLHSSLSKSTSSTNSEKQKVMECYALQDLKTHNWNAKKRAKSGKARSNSVSKDDTMKAFFSDSAANYRRSKMSDEIRKALLQNNVESSFIIEMKENDQRSTVFYKNDMFEKEDLNSDRSDSTGTYIIGTTSNTRDNDRNAMKVFANDLEMNNTENYLNIIKNFESDDSVASNATFTIENEVPMLKSRRKNKSSLK